jgi:hypothetical protein
VTAAIAGPAKPRFDDFPPQHAELLLERVRSAPAPYRRLLRAAFPRTKIRATREYNASYVAIERRGGVNHYVMYLDLKTRRKGAYGDHLTTHELGHVIHHEWFDDADYQRFFDLFRQSPNWRDCFETGIPENPCVNEQEILADQLAFYATGNLDFRSDYNVPPLADRPSMTAAINASAPR